MAIDLEERLRARIRGPGVVVSIQSTAPGVDPATLLVRAILAVVDSMPETWPAPRHLTMLDYTAPLLMRIAETYAEQTDVWVGPQRAHQVVREIVDTMGDYGLLNSEISIRSCTPPDA